MEFPATRRDGIRVFDSLIKPGALTSRVSDICKHARIQKVSVGVRISGESLFAEARASTSPATQTSAESAGAPVGCLAKPLTATLLADLVAQRRLSWETPVDDVLRIRGLGRDKLRSRTIGHLLDHTHGLDGSHLGVVPRTQDGLVDATSLCEQLARTPLSEPGELYSYSNTGAWLAGAVLEELSDAPFAELLFGRLSELEMRSDVGIGQSSGGGPICPATGDSLELNAAQWLSFLDLHLQAGKNCSGSSAIIHPLAALQTVRVTMPGWSPAETAACIGWKYYGEGWFGHNANLDTISALLRFNPRADVAIVVIAANDAAFYTLAGLLGTALPELANLDIPHFLDPQERRDFDPAQYVGVFSQERMRIVISPATEGLIFELQARQAAASPSTGELRAARDEVFFLSPPAHREFPFMQFVRPSRAHVFDYLWNGKQLWRRE